MSKSRGLIAGGLSVAAIGAFVVAQALATTTTWKGTGTRDPQLTVSFKKVSGHPAKVKYFKARNMHYACVGTNDFRSGLDLPPMKVHRGRFSFSGTANQNGVTYKATLSGEFVSKRTAKGTVKETRTVNADTTIHCTGQEPWRAHRQ
jgi:hypothetical protein